MDDLRAAVATALALQPASRLIVLDAAEWVDASSLAVFAAVGRDATTSPRAVVADPLRLPFVAALADVVLATSDPARAAEAPLREIWRVLAPAGALVLIVPLPSSHSLNSLITRGIVRRRVGRRLAAAMFDVATWQATATAAVVRATKRDGLARQRPATAAVHAPALA